MLAEAPLGARVVSPVGMKWQVHFAFERLEVMVHVIDVNDEMPALIEPAKPARDLDLRTRATNVLLPANCDPIGAVKLHGASD